MIPVSRKCGVICVRVPVRSSSGGQYESSWDVKKLPCSSSGEYKSHTVSTFSLMPPQPCGQLWTVARETRAKAAGSQWKWGRLGLCLCISLLWPQAARAASGWGRVAGRKARSETALVAVCFITSSLLQLCSIKQDEPMRRSVSRRVELLNRNAILLAYWPPSYCISVRTLMQK